MRQFTVEELGKYDGSSGLAYVAYRGKVFDVSSSYHWRTGSHHARHHAGLDLTDALQQAPHGVALLEKFPMVGELQQQPR